MSLFKNIFNYLGFSLCWYLLVKYGNSALLWLVLGYFLIHCVLVKDTLKKELVLVSLVCVLGVLFDNLFTYVGVYQFNGSIFTPLWFILLWPLFASTLLHSLYFLVSQKYWVIALSGLVFAPIAYYGGSLISPNFSFGYATIPALTVIALYWAVLFPVLAVITKKVEKSYAA